MKKTKGTKIILSLAVAIVLAAGTYAFADRGDGYGPHMGGYGYGSMGYGRHMGSGYGPGSMMGYGGYGNRTGLSDDDAKKVEKEQNTFSEATEALRRNLYTKRLELRSELSKETPSTQKAAELQKEISALQGQLDQKRIDYALALKKINPNIGAGSYAGRGPRGFGPNAGGGRFSGRGPMGFGPNGGGYCWQ